MLQLALCCTQHYICTRQCVQECSISAQMWKTKKYNLAHLDSILVKSLHLHSNIRRFIGYHAGKKQLSCYRVLNHEPNL